MVDPDYYYSIYNFTVKFQEEMLLLLMLLSCFIAPIASTKIVLPAGHNQVSSAHLALSDLFAQQTLLIVVKIQNFLTNKNNLTNTAKLRKILNFLNSNFYFAIRKSMLN